MDFDAFLADCRAQWPDFDDVKPRAAEPRDRSLRAVREAVHGLSTENVMMLLNRAVGRLSPGEVYVEIGCFEGLTLAGALFGHPGATAYACDDFSQFGGPRALLARTIATWTAPGQVRFHEMEMRRFLAAAPWAPARVGAYFYDGSHGFDDQFVALQGMLHHLAPNAAVIVDDTNGPLVRAANRLLTRHAPGFDLVRDIRTPTANFPSWFNGVQVYRWRGGTGTVGARWRYEAHRRFWDGAFLPAERRYYRVRRRLGRVPGLHRAWVNLTRRRA
jgi:hypothetical protein